MSKSKPTQRDTGRAATLASVLAFQISADAVTGASAPEWVHIFPLGPVVATNDGRAFRISDPARLASSIMAGTMPVLVDYDHRSYYDASLNGETLAAGWCTAVEARSDGIWARVEWTPAANRAVIEREYRFISPEFSVDRDSGEVVALAAISLVNRPAFTMTALARSTPQRGEDDMRAIAAALGLPEDADEAAILAAINTTTTELASARTPPADRFVPRADYDTALARATAAETALAARDEAARTAEVETVIAAAVAEGKIAPASKPHYLALAATPEGFEQVKQLCGTLPKVVADLPPGVQAAGGTMTPAEKHIAACMGLSDEQFIAARAARAAAET